MSAKKRVERARKVRERLGNQIFALAPDDRTRFNDCLKLAAPELREAYWVASRAEIEAEAEAVSTGRAYRDSLGGLIWNRR